MMFFLIVRQTMVLLKMSRINLTLISSAAPALTATYAAGATVGTTTATATAGAEDTLAYCLRGSALAPNGGAYIFGLTSYTSAAEIKANVGQVLNLFELDANGRVVKFVAQELVTADIKA